MQRISNRAPSNQPTSHASEGLGGAFGRVVGVALAVLGTAVLLGGFFLEAFKKIQGVPTSPLVKEVILFLGACILSVGLVLAGKRVAVGLGSAMLLAGIAIYVLGFTSDHPLAALFPFVGVFVGVFGGFIIAASAGWLDAVSAGWSDCRTSQLQRPCPVAPQASLALSRGSSVKTRVPSHLLEWAHPSEPRDDGFFLLVFGLFVRCPCGNDRLAYSCLRHKVIGLEVRAGPARLGGRFRMVVGVECPICKRNKILFDDELHGWSDDGPPKPESPEHPRPPLLPWKCVACGEIEHRGQIFLDYGEAPLTRKEPVHGSDGFQRISMSLTCWGCRRVCEWFTWETWGY